MHFAPRTATEAAWNTNVSIVPNNISKDNNFQWFTYTNNILDIYTDFTIATYIEKLRHIIFAEIHQNADINNTLYT